MKKIVFALPMLLLAMAVCVSAETVDKTKQVVIEKNTLNNFMFSGNGNGFQIIDGNEVAATGAFPSIQFSYIEHVTKTMTWPEIHGAVALQGKNADGYKFRATIQNLKLRDVIYNTPDAFYAKLDADLYYEGKVTPLPVNIYFDKVTKYASVWADYWGAYSMKVTTPLCASNFYTSASPTIKLC